MNRLTAGLLCGACLCLSAAASAQPAQSKGPIDIVGNELEVDDAQHLAIWRGDVDAIQGQDRLRSDMLKIYYTGKPGTSAGGESSAQPGVLGSTGGKVDHMVADGNVYFVSPTQNARGDHAIYDVAPDIITMTGDVVVVQGQNVVHGEKLVIDLKTNHATMLSSNGQTTTGRVRGVFYPNDSSSQNGPAGSAGRPQ